MKKSDVDRRAFLASLASTGMLAACSSRAAGPLGAASGGPLIPPLGRDAQAKLLLTNSSGSSTVYYYVVGKDGPGGPWSYLKADGKIARAVAGADFAIPLSQLPNPTCPKFDSARVLVSIEKKLTLKVDERTGEPVTPPGWVKTNNPDYDVLYDWVEFTYDSKGLGANTSFVDMTSLPLSLKLTGSKGPQRVGPKPGAGPSIYAGMRSHPNFGNLIVTSGGKDLRVIAPGHGIEAGVFPADYLDLYIADCWNYFKNNDLSVTYQWPVGKTLKATGRVDSSGKFAFKRDGKLVRSIPKPTTKDVFFCNGALLANNDEGGQIAAVIGAALNRTVLRGTSSQPQCTSSGFYSEKHTNFYSLVLHQNVIDGLCYGFPFDDICNLFSSYIHDSAPSQLEITIGKN